LVKHERIRDWSTIKERCEGIISLDLELITNG
jgi:hypothetical protein